MRKSFKKLIDGRKKILICKTYAVVIKNKFFIIGVTPHVKKIEISFIEFVPVQNPKSTEDIIYNSVYILD